VLGVLSLVFAAVLWWALAGRPAAALAGPVST
jgi:hypothetical protein